MFLWKCQFFYRTRLQPVQGSIDSRFYQLLIWNMTAACPGKQWQLPLSVTFMDHDCRLSTLAVPVASISYLHGTRLQPAQDSSDSRLYQLPILKHDCSLPMVAVTVASISYVYGPRLQTVQASSDSRLTQLLILEHECSLSRVAVTVAPISYLHWNAISACLYQLLILEHDCSLPRVAVTVASIR